MVHLLVCLAVALASVSGSALTASDANPELGPAFQKLMTLELGQSLALFQPIRQAVVRSRVDEQVRLDLERRLIAVLEGNATDLGKDYACRQLVIVGADRSIPVLARLLSNPRMAAMARHAMEGIGSPAAIEALRKMLTKTNGSQQVGVVISLGRLADGGAVAELAALLSSEDEQLRRVTVVALGRIGTVAAAGALEDFAPKALRDVVVDAQLQAAQLLCGRGEFKVAARICESLLAAESQRVRAAAYRGLIAAKPSESMDLILGGLRAGQSWKRAVAADCVTALRNPEDIKTIAAAVSSLPVAGKVAALHGLQNRRDSAVRKAALTALDQANAEVRATALATLVTSATSEDVPKLADLATADSDDRVRDAAFETLRLMDAGGTNRALIAQMRESKTPVPVLVKCALARRSADFVPAFVAAAASPDAATRLEAFKALAIMATEKEARSLARLLCKTAPGEEREAADRAVWMSCQKISDPALRRDPLLAAMKEADSAGQCAILPTLARMGGAKSLEAVHVAMRSDNQAVRDAGYRALANWPDATVAEELLDIAKTSNVGSYRVWSLRAFARVVSLPSERPPQKTFEMLKEAFFLAKRGEDKELIVSRLGSVRVPEALALLVTLLSDEQLSKTTIAAVFTLAKGISQSHPEEAKAALEKIRPLTDDAAMLQQIPKVLRDIDARKRGRKKT